jgi:hypothetical protein
MKRTPARKRLGAIGGMLGVLFTMPCLSAREHKAHPYRYSVVDMPVSLAMGTVHTPAFAPASNGHWYWILVQFEKPLPFRDMQCMTGVKIGTNDFKDCVKEQLIDADWTVMSEGHVVSQGSSHGFGAAKFTKDYIFKFLGGFKTQPGRTYVLDVTFTKDGTPLNIAHPHLIVVKQGEE